MSRSLIPPLEPRARARARRSFRAALGRIAKRAVLVLGVAGAGALLAFAGFHFAAQLSWFRVARVEITGTSYLTRAEILGAAGIEAGSSVLEKRSRLEERIEALALVESATVERDLPSTLLLAIDEAKPVALVAEPIVVPVDRAGNRIPFGPRTALLDLPLLRVVPAGAAAASGAAVPSGLPTLADEVSRLAEQVPEVFAVLSEARGGDREVTLLLGESGVKVRYRPPFSEPRLRAAIVALNDAAKRFPERSPHEVDLRFEDQVVVRTAVVVEAGGG